RLVYTSSLAALGIPAPDRRLVEADRFNLRPRQFPYGHTKHLAEELVRAAASAGLAAVIVNPSIVVGPRDIHQGSGSMLLEARRGRLRIVPPGGVNFVAAADVVRGHLAAVRSGTPG